MFTSIYASRWNVDYHTYRKFEISRFLKVNYVYNRLLVMGRYLFLSLLSPYLIYKWPGFCKLNIEPFKLQQKQNKIISQLEKCTSQGIEWRISNKIQFFGAKIHSVSDEHNQHRTSTYVHANIFKHSQL